MCVEQIMKAPERAKPTNLASLDGTSANHFLCPPHVV